jgi:hypothetical protein
MSHSARLQGIGAPAAKAMVDAVAPHLDQVARRVSAFGLAEGRRRSLGMVGQMGAELALGTRHLYELGLWYPGAATVRQLVEAEYLLHLFVSDPEEADRWALATDRQARSIFSPASMRKRSLGRFDDAEYDAHCAVGGHPRKAGAVLLREWVTPLAAGTTALFDPRALWTDLAQHVERSWGLFTAGIRLHSPTNIYPDRIHEVQAAIDAWHAADPLVTSI